MTPCIILSQPPLPTFWGATPPIIISITQYYIIFYTLQPYRVASLSLFSVVCGFIVRSLPWYFYSIIFYSTTFPFFWSILFYMLYRYLILDYGSLTYCDFDILSWSMFRGAFLYCLYNILYICFFICHLITLIFFYFLLHFKSFWVYYKYSSDT